MGNGGLATERCDLAIVGGGPAGLATALFAVHADPALASRIVVLEMATYPRDKICGGAVGGRADTLLESIGAGVHVPSAYVNGFSVKSVEVTRQERRQRIGRVVRRIEYDHELANVARARGIRIEEDTRVTRLDIDATGVSIQTSRGELRAQAVVGADGVGSIVRRTLGLGAGSLRAQVIEVDTEQVSSDPPRDLLHFDLSDPSFSGYEWDFPTIVDGQPLVCRGVYHLKFDDRPQDIHARLERRLDARGLSLSRYRTKRFAERGFEPHLPYAAPRVALVGEAAGIDAVTGEGIAEAIEYGAFAGPYLARRLAARELSFHDWSEQLVRSNVGRDLKVRHWLLPYYFGKHRAWFERHFTMHPEVVACSVEQFAGRPISQWTWTKATAGAVWDMATNVLRRRISKTPV